MQKILILLVMALPLLGCSQQMQLTLSEDESISGSMNVNMELFPVFSRYLKDIDLFSGIEVADDVLPTSVSDILREFRQNNNNYQQQVVYNLSNGGFKVKYGFSFSSLTTLFNDQQSPFFKRAVQVDRVNGLTTVRLFFDAAARERMQDLYPMLIPLPQPVNQANFSLYQDDVASTMASSAKERPAAKTELNSSSVKLTVLLPRPARSVQGGRLDPDNNRQIFFDIPLMAFLYPEKALNISFSY